jgi:hypothetical protein
MRVTGLAAMLASLQGRLLSDAELEASSVAVAQALLAQISGSQTRVEQQREQLLSRLMSDAAGQTFTTCLTDRVYRSRDPAMVVDVARQLLRALGVPRYLPVAARAQLQLFLRAAPFVPEFAASLFKFIDDLSDP